uniref:DUF1640 domain-containing protein n=1 Tax=Desulfacinum infernum TaxID=35837 RepID=A0A831ZYW8_9BACT
MSLSSQTEDAVLEQKIAAVVHQILQREGEQLFAEKIAAFVQENERRARELALMERGVRVEEELKALREIQNVHFNAAGKRFEAMDKRFEALQREMTTRFEALQREMTAHFEAVDQRFEAMDKRFRSLEWMIGAGLTVIVAFLSLLRIFS